MPGVLFCSAHQALKGAPWLRDRCVRHLKGHPGWGPALCSSVHQVFDGPASLLFNCRCWYVEREAMVMAAPTTCDSAVSPCFHGAWLSSTGISHHSLLPHTPSICLSTVNTSPCLGIVPQSLNSSSQPLHLPGDLCPCLGSAWLWQGLSDSHSFRLPQVSCFTLSLTCFSSDSDNCPDVGIGLLLQFLHPLRAGPVLLTLPFPPLVPSSYRVLCGSIYSFLPVRYPCLSQLVFCLHFCV